MRNRAIFFAAIFYFILGVADARTINKCTNEDGTVTFSDAPCAEAIDEMERIQIYLPEPAPPPSAEDYLAAHDRVVQQAYDEYIAERQRLVKELDWALEQHSRNRSLDQWGTRREVRRHEKKIEELDNTWRQQLNKLSDPSSLLGRCEAHGSNVVCE